MAGSFKDRMVIPQPWRRGAGGGQSGPARPSGTFDPNRPGPATAGRRHGRDSGTAGPAIAGIQKRPGSAIAGIQKRPDRNGRYADTAGIRNGQDADTVGTRNGRNR
ncbi:hypothetical protein GCM10010532_014070 [Dactylosporangium siamense]|uniref:Uncharacterized protein n=1 Tax=Dactylosporangium siamense TaxID=685454 RepID=A0A919U5D4_9ACTN|nr:hypothetical protein Dsi01nite_002330 [Dactylosporangium siamense]